MGHRKYKEVKDLSLTPEPVSERFRRDWEEIQDDRKIRGLDQQSDERQSRVYVERTTGVSETGKSSDEADVLYEQAFGE